MEVLLEPVVELYRYVLQPAAPFSWFGLPISALDVAGTLRLCVAMRQVKEAVRRNHLAKVADARRAVKGKNRVAESAMDDELSGLFPDPIFPLEERSLAMDAATTLLVVYGGEIVTSPFLGSPPSFMVSGVFPVFFALMQVAVEYLPVVPIPTLTNELPLSFLDAMSRAVLLCTLIPPSVIAHRSPSIATSPWSLLLTSLLTANGGFFLANAFSMFAPTGMRLATPPELMPYGWTTTDLWAAPFVTGIYALLTHAQPFWADLHAVIAGMLGGRMDAGYGSASATDPSGMPISVGIKPLDPETARAACAIVLATMFATRASKNFANFGKSK